MKRNLIWDLPVRFFHWLLAGSFIGAFVIANVVDDESSTFVLHMLLGGVAAFMVVLRVVWGFVGTRWSRFSSFALRPSELFSYIFGALKGAGARYSGHNPGTSFAALGMFVLLPAVAISGALMSKGEVFEEVHEILAWSLVALVVAHLAGIAVHTLRHKEFIAWSMVDGRKQAPDGDAIHKTRPVVALTFLGITGAWAAALVSGYDATTNTVTVPVIGKTITLGEGEHEREGERLGGHEEND